MQINCLKTKMQFYFPVALFVTAVFMVSCTESPTALTLGDDYVESQTHLSVTDTLSVELSTVLLDSVVTSGTGQMLVGHTEDPVFGQITSHSCFQMGVPASIVFEESDQYDSLSLILLYNGYTFGDTLPEQKIEVHQLLENIESEDDAGIDRKTVFARHADALGELIYSPRPGGGDTLRIKLDDQTGLDLFQLMADDSDILASVESFVNYFPGLILAADPGYEGAIVGFSAATSIKMVLYSSNRDASEEEIIENEFPLYDTSKQFNQIEYEYSATALNPLFQQRDALPASETMNLAYMQGSIGLVMRVDFPSLPEMLLMERGLIVKAELSLSPQKNSYNTFDLPTSISLYRGDGRNRIQENVTTSSLTVDALYDEDTAYHFDITDYLKNELADGYVDPEDGLMLTLLSGQQNLKLDRWVAAADGPRTELIIHYLSY